MNASTGVDLVGCPAFQAPLLSEAETAANLVIHLRAFTNTCAGHPTPRRVARREQIGP
jgi:hypothetical protein